MLVLFDPLYVPDKIINAFSFELESPSLIEGCGDDSVPSQGSHAESAETYVNVRASQIYTVHTQTVAVQNEDIVVVVLEQSNNSNHGTQHSYENP